MQTLSETPEPRPATYHPELLTLGGCLVGLGTLGVAANLGVVTDVLGALRRLWPASLVIWGLAELWRWRAAGGRS